MTTTDSLDDGRGARGPQAADGATRLPWWVSFSLVLALLVLLVCTGAALRMVVVPGTALTVALVAGLVAVPSAFTLVRRLTDRGWAGYERENHQVAAEGSHVLEAIVGYLDALPKRRWDWVQVLVTVEGRGQSAISVHPSRNHLLVAVQGDQISELGPTFAVTSVARMVSLTCGWRYQSRVTLCFVRLGGLIILGWAVRWPWLLVALGIFQAAATAMSWLIELSADRYVLVHCPRKTALQVLSSASASDSPDPATWRKWVVLIISMLSARLPPPDWLRQAIARLEKSPDVP